jgi:NTE family protein
MQYNLLGRIGLTILANGYFGRFYSSANAEIRVDIPERIPLFIKADVTYNHKDYFKNSTYFFEDKDPSFLVSNESHFNIQAGIPVADNGILSVNGAIGFSKDNYYQTNQFTRTDTADVTYFDFVTPGISLEFNTLNFKQFPTKGYHLYFGFKYINGEERTDPGSTSEDVSNDTVQYHDWVQLKLLYNYYFQINKWFKVGLYSEFLFSSQESFSNYTATILRTPAFEPIPEMKTLFLAKYRSLNYGSLGIQPVLSPYKNFDIRLEGYLLQPFQKIEQTEDQEAIREYELGDMAFVLSGSLIYHIRMVPVSLSFNYYSQGADKFSVLFNIGFIIFNKSALE